MSQLSSPVLSPGGIFARIETLKKWQLEQQKRLVQQQAEQEEFLTNEHKRMFDALGLGMVASQKNRPIEQRNARTEAENLQYKDVQPAPSNNFDTELGVSILEISDDEPDVTECEIVNKTNVDEIPIKSPKKDFKELLEEKLQSQNEKMAVGDSKQKPKRPFLKRGAGLSRYRMTIDDLAYKQKPKLIHTNNLKKSEVQVARSAKVENNKKCESDKEKNENECRPKVVTFEASNIERERHVDEAFKIHKPILKKPFSSNKRDEITHRATWTRVSEEPEISREVKENDYKALLEEIMEMRQMHPRMFEQISGNVPDNQKQTENDLLDELRLFELLEQNVANSSFSSTSSLVTRLMEHAFKGSPSRLVNNPVASGSPIRQYPMFPNEKEITKQPESDNIVRESQFMSRLIQNSTKSTPKPITSTKNNLQFEETPVQAPHVEFKVQEDFSQMNLTESSEAGTEQLCRDDVEGDSDTSSITSDDISNVQTDKTLTDERGWSDDSEDKATSNATSINNSLVITVADVATNTDDLSENYNVTSDILKGRLEELEKELATFRTENSRVNKLKSDLETETRNLNKRKRQLEKDFEEKERELNARMEEEKRKVARERAVYDRYTREMRNKTTKKDKEELTLLQSQLASVKEELKLKESRWGAMQARLRNQIKHLEKENVSLKADNEELRRKNGRLEAAHKQLTSKKPSDTKMLHEINKNLTKLAKEAKIVVPKTAAITSTAKYKPKHQVSRPQDKARPRLTVSTSSEDEDSTEESSDSDPTLKLLKMTKARRKDKENNCNSLNVSNNNDSIKSKSSDRSFESIERDYEKVFGKMITKESLPAANASAIDDSYKKSRDEILLEDGSKKITYSNGNIKTISPDGDLTVMKYYNGDMKETCYSTGTIKYFYAEANTWHTTYPDGHEILEFSNGQVEKRFKDGSSEIFFPNGCQRCVSPGGTEEIKFPDGTVLINNGSGQKILNLPNGQKEIHTADHKRREYPDGTVKLLYPDGIQETRYANGRIRLKDKDGNLIMDSGSI